MHRLYIAHLGAGSVVVYDTQQSQVIAEVPGVPGVHGVIALPELGRAYATATSSRQIAAIDTAALLVVAMAQGDGYPDGLAYAPHVGKVYVSDEQDGNESVIDVQSNQRIGAISLGGEAGNTQYDPVSHRIYVAVQTRNQVVTIDPTADQVVDQHDTPGCDHPHGLLIDSDQQRAFVDCQGNDKLIVMDMTSWQVISTQDVGKSPDVLSMDSGLHLVYVAAENGPLAVFRDDETGVTRIAFQSAGPNGHVVAVDLDTHSIYMPLANVNGHPVLRELAIDLPTGNRAIALFSGGRMNSCRWRLLRTPARPEGAEITHTKPYAINRTLYVPNSSHPSGEAWKPARRTHSASMTSIRHVPCSGSWAPAASYRRSANPS